MNNTGDICICNGHEYSIHCPNAFLQGGKMLHLIGGTAGSPGSQCVEISAHPHAPEDRTKLMQIERETKSDPRVFNIVGTKVSPSVGPNGDSDDSDENWTNLIPNALNRIDPGYNEVRNAQMVDGNSMMHANRVSLRKFEPLRVAGQELTDLSIGGFQVDLSKAAQKAAIVAPLPPAKLPKIYLDNTMNFLHHFFQGLERLIGRDVLLTITEKSKFSTGGDLILLPLIEHMMKVGFERKDNNLTVFVKSVLTSTFEMDERNEPNDPERGLLVAANLWGFRYIECGIEMKEADLQMWLKTNYENFKVLHFDTFKDSGVPAFVTEGVQIRYEPVVRQDNSISLLSVEKRGILGDYGRDQDIHDGIFDDTRSSRGHRRRHRRHREPSIGNLFFGNH